MNNLSITKIIKLPVNQRIKLVEDIWDSIADNQVNIELTSRQKEELDRRYELYLKNPSFGKTWKQIKKNLKNKK